MKSSAWQSLLARAVAAGIVPVEARDAPPAEAARPWPVVVLTFLGAQLAAIPLLAFAGLLMGRVLMEGAGPYFCGLLLLVLSLVVLRARDVVLFVEHLALVSLVVGIGLLSYALFRDFEIQGGAVLSALLCLGCAALVPAAWARCILGASAAAFTLSFALDERMDTPLLLLRIWGVGLGMGLAWLAACYAQSRLVEAGRPLHATVLEHVMGGWLMILLAAFALSSGTSMLIGAASGGSVTGNVVGMLQHELVGRYLVWRHAQAALAAMLPVLAWLWASRRWAQARQPLACLLALALAVLSWFMPALGPVCAIALVCLLTHRAVQAAAAALAAAWIIGSFYYGLSWSLVEKSQVLVVVGLVLAVCVWLTRLKGVTDAAAPAPHGQARAVLVAILVGLLATLTVVNGGIWQKESLLANGRKVYIELAPVDPRSLMQGDYMALSYRLAPPLQNALNDLPSHFKPLAQGHIDARGVVQLDALADGAALADDAIRIALLNKGGRWLVASDAWFFREGDGARWALARYAEFRVTPDGKALLAGMADRQLQPIRP